MKVMQMQIGLPACCIHLTLNNMCHHPPIVLDVPLIQSYFVQGMVWCQMCMLVICSPITASSSALYHTLRYRDPGKVSIRKWRTIDIPAFTSDVGDCLALVPISADSSQLLSSLSTIFTDVLDAHAPQSFKDIVIRPQQLWYTNELRAGKKSHRKSEQKVVRP